VAFAMQRKYSQPYTKFAVKEGVFMEIKTGTAFTLSAKNSVYGCLPVMTYHTF
jgi:hypothetical protein